MPASSRPTGCDSAWPRGRRRRFAKPLYGPKAVSRVRIPPSPPDAGGHCPPACELTGRPRRDRGGEGKSRLDPVPPPFPRTLRSLSLDRSRYALPLFVVAVALLVGWGIWAVSARVEVPSGPPGASGTRG